MKVYNSFLYQPETRNHPDTLELVNGETVVQSGHEYYLAIKKGKKNH